MSFWRNQILLGLIAALSLLVTAPAAVLAVNISVAEETVHNVEYERNEANLTSRARSSPDKTSKPTVPTPVLWLAPLERSQAGPYPTTFPVRLHVLNCVWRN